MCSVVICERCSTESPDSFQFCPGCGAPLLDMPAPRQIRKIVTALFCDVTGSTALGEELDPEVLREVLNRYFADIRATIERHGGTVEKFIGDAVMAVFGIPQVHEDDALRAVRAAAEIRERLPAVAEEVGVSLRFRTGVNTGQVLMGEGENLAVGDAVNVAARLEQAAAPGEIVLGPGTLELVRNAVQVQELEPLDLKGKSEPVRAYRLLSVDPDAPGFARHLDVKLVGRERELRLLGEVWERAVSEAGCHMFTLLGTAGVGKSRLVGELLASVGAQATVLRGRCLHYGEGITFWPLVEALMPVGEPAEQLLEHFSSGGAGTPAELFWEARRLLESLAGQQPLILHIDDLQWAEPMLLDLLDHVVDLSRGAPMLLLCTARPELLEERPSWGGGKLNATTVLLEALGADEAETLLDQLGDGIGPEARAQVIAASEGNPLFLEEMVALARERGTVTVPPTIQALLAARLERLALQERELLERGAVEGEVFHRLAVKALADERLKTEIEVRLAGLVRKELIRPHPATVGVDDAFRFRHLLIRDAAYEGLPKAARAELHERFAVWLEETAGELVELDEIAGWHLEQAVRYQRELGRSVAPEITYRAAEHLRAAGVRASARDDLGAARSLLERAFALVADDSALRFGIAVDLAEQLIETGDLARADELLSLAEREPDRAGHVAVARFQWLIRARPDEATETIQSRLPEIIEQLTRAGDERGLAKAHLAAFNVHWLASRAAPAGDAAQLAATHAARAHDESLRTQALSSYGATLLLGPANSAAIIAFLDALEQDAPGPALRAFTEIGRGEIERLSGHFDEAVRHTSLGIEGLNALGNLHGVGSYQHLGHIHMTAGDPQTALPWFQRADEGLAAAGERSYRSTVQARLAEVYEALGDREAARAAIELSDEMSAEEDVINFAMTHPIRARLALAEQDHEAAERWARSAVRHAYMTDFVGQHASARRGLAQVLQALGRPDEAETEAREALTICEAKGDLPGARQAQDLLARLVSKQ